LGLIQGHEERVGSGISLGLIQGHGERAETVGLVWGLIQGYGERAGQWDEFGD